MNFIVNTTLRLLLLGKRERERESEEKSDYRSTRAEEGAVARCVLELIVICVYICLTQAHYHLHHDLKSISSFSPSSQSTKSVCLTRRNDNTCIHSFCLSLLIDQVNERVAALIRFSV